MAGAWEPDATAALERRAGPESKGPAGSWPTLRAGVWSLFCPPVATGIALLPARVILRIVPVPPVVGTGIPEPGAVVEPIPATWVYKERSPGQYHVKKTFLWLPLEKPGHPRTEGCS